MLNVLVNATPLLSRLTGVGIYTLNISQNLVKLYDSDIYKYYYGYVSKKLIDGSGKKGEKNLKLVKGLISKIPCGRSYAKRLRDYFQLRNFDIYFEPNFVPFLPVLSKKTVTTVHDFSFLKQNWVPNDRYEYFKKIFLNTIYKSDFIITPSEYIRNEALDFLKFDSERIMAIHHGIDHSVFCLEPKERGNGSLSARIKQDKGNIPTKQRNSINILPDSYLLFVGSIQPRKNVIGLLNAYKSLPPSLRKQYKLLLVGFESWKSNDVSDMIRCLANDVVMLDSVDGGIDLADIYRKSAALVFPSFYEGFGFTPLEAMACGCPVIVSNTSCLPEICGDSAYYVDPDSIESIAEGMYTLLTNERLKEKMIRKGLERVRLFNWEESARKHHELFQFNK